jgi:hypothetical protein
MAIKVVGVRMSDERVKAMLLLPAGGRAVGRRPRNDLDPDLGGAHAGKPGDRLERRAARAWADVSCGYGYDEMEIVLDVG